MNLMIKEEINYLKFEIICEREIVITEIVLY